MIKGLAFVALPATDPKRAGAFYREVLGLRAGDWNEDAWVEVTTGCGCAIALEHAKHPYIALETDDIALEITRLRNLGVEVVADIRPSVEQEPDAYCRAAWIKDSEGNNIMIHQLRPELGW
ncbi:MAG: VOC family protein [Limnochordia bacterium]|jgi:predicted enzyme related to lactoylglutathione lyase